MRATRRGAAPAPRAYAAGGGALPLHPAPTRRAAGRCPCTPRLRGGRRGAALHPAPARRAAGRCPCTPRLRGGRRGSALHPLGLSPQTPEMLAHLCLACGRDGGLVYGLRTVACAVLFMHIG
ncbi:hypothetical protein D3Z52_07735 [Clostridiaceae bacterium]|nr:hypothetical protein [Clostridiaceae bacterium]